MARYRYNEDHAFSSITGHSDTEKIVTHKIHINILKESKLCRKTILVQNIIREKKTSMAVQEVAHNVLLSRKN